MILPYCPAIFECGAVIKGVWWPRRGELLYCGVPAVPVASARQGSSQPVWGFGHSTRGRAPQLSFPFPLLLVSPHSFKTLPQVVLFQIKCFGRNTGPSKWPWKRATPAHPERSPTISSTLALWLYGICNTRKFCTPAEQLEMNTHTGDYCYKHWKFSYLFFDSNLSSDPGIAHSSLHYPCLNHSLWCGINTNYTGYPIAFRRSGYLVLESK